MRRLIKQEYDVRALLAWQLVGRIILAEAIPSSAGLVRQAKEEVVNALDIFCTDLRHADDAAIRVIPGSNWPHHYTLKELAIARVESEIEIALFAAQRAAAQTPATNVTIINPVGIVQTGAASIAMLTQNFGATERETLERALAAVKDELSQSTELPEPERTEVLAVVQDAEAEVRAQRPNLVRLRGALSAIATSVQTLGSARAAYELLKGAALLVGVQLP